MILEKHHKITARGITAKQIAKMALEGGFRGFDASQKKYQKPSVYQGLRAFYIGSKTACRWFKSFCPCQNTGHHISWCPVSFMSKAALTLVKMAFTISIRFYSLLCLYIYTQVQHTACISFSAGL